MGKTPRSDERSQQGIPRTWRAPQDRPPGMIEFLGVESREVEVEMYRIQEAKLADQPFEGHLPVTGKPVVEKQARRFPAGSVRISTDQSLGDLAVILLEPNSPDSFFQWGFFLEVLSPTEYVEEYVKQPMAERMLAEEAQLKGEFEQKLKADSIFT